MENTNESLRYMRSGDPTLISSFYIFLTVNYLIITHKKFHEIISPLLNSNIVANYTQINISIHHLTYFYHIG